jgi:hypothetical protein
MGASSVTGTGNGIGRNKGPRNGRNTFVPALGANVVTAGHCMTNGGGGATIQFPTPLQGGFMNYSITALAATGSTPNITIIGAPNTFHHYAVIKVGVPFKE